MVYRMSKQAKPKRNAIFEAKVVILEAVSFMIIAVGLFSLGCYGKYFIYIYINV